LVFTLKKEGNDDAETCGDGSGRSIFLRRRKKKRTSGFRCQKGRKGQERTREKKRGTMSVAGKGKETLREGGIFPPYPAAEEKVLIVELGQKEKPPGT